MVGFYKHDIPAWMDGTEALSDGAYRAYHVIVQLIMLNEGPIAMNERGLAGRCNQAIKSFRTNLKELLDAKKLLLVDGRLWNSRAETELQAVMKNRSNASLGGLSGKKSPQKSPEPIMTGSSSADDGPIDAANPLKTNGANQASLKEDASLKEKRREEKSREEPPKAPTAPAPEEPALFEDLGNVTVLPRAKRGGPSLPDIAVAFDAFWEAYPRREGGNPKKPALDKFVRAVRQGSDPAAIIAGAKAYGAMIRRTGKADTQ